jgi:hypothetical protein
LFIKIVQENLQQMFSVYFSVPSNLAQNLFLTAAAATALAVASEVEGYLTIYSRVTVTHKKRLGRQDL